jgi:hypothetical protein
MAPGGRLVQLHYGVLAELVTLYSLLSMPAGRTAKFLDASCDVARRIEMTGEAKNCRVAQLS